MTAKRPGRGWRRFAGFALLAAGHAAAADLGTILSLRAVTGKDGSRYIEIGHSDRDLQPEGSSAIAGWSSPFQYMEVYLREPANRLESLFIWSILKEAHACRCITLQALSGAHMPGVVEGNNQPVRIDEYRFNYRW